MFHHPLKARYTHVSRYVLALVSGVITAAALTGCDDLRFHGRGVG